MLTSFLLSLREGLEAALLIGIILGALDRIQRKSLAPVVWRAVAAAIILSLVVGIFLQVIGSELEGSTEMIFEGTTFFLAAALLTWMIFWMRHQAASHNKAIADSIRLAASQADRAAIFLLVFAAVVREGLELAIFLLAAGISATPFENISGPLLGLAAAAAMGWLAFSTTRKMNMKNFFMVTNILLILFAAGLVAHGFHEFNEIGWVPPVIDPVWNINPILNENLPVGQFLSALFGYNGDPSLTETIAYSGFLVMMMAGLFIKRKSAGSQLPQ